MRKRRLRQSRQNTWRQTTLRQRRRLRQTQRRGRKRRKKRRPRLRFHFPILNTRSRKVQQLYKKLIEARTAAGDKASAPSLKDFERFVLQKTKDLKNKGGHEIEYTVSVEAGRVKLKARISS